MKSAISPVVPRSIERAKRIAKQLHDIYPHHPLAKTQAVTAHLFFQPDWHTLNAVLKAGKPAGPFDQELSESEFKQRRKAQRAIVCRELGGVDPDVSAPPPKAPDYKKDPNSLILQAVMGSASPHAMNRLEMAAIRWQQRLAMETINEIGPTLEKPSPQTAVTDLFTLCSGEWLATLPQLLARWWRVNVPHQPIVADSLDGYVLEPNRRISLLKFGGYWGELCMHYASTIDWTMAMGTAYLLAERYGTIMVHEDPALYEIAPRLKHCSDEEFDTLLEPFFDKQTQFARYFFEVYPRDDFQDVYDAQPFAFAKDAGECIKILKSPKSKKGKWKDG